MMVVHWNYALAALGWMLGSRCFLTSTLYSLYILDGLVSEISCILAIGSDCNKQFNREMLMCSY